MKKYLFILFSSFVFNIGFGQGLTKQTEYLVHFPSDKHSLTSAEKQKLDEFLTSLKNYDISKIGLSGHTDSDGSKDYNIALSQRRVVTVQAQILKILGEEQAIFSVHHGEEKPIDVNTTPTGKQNNRRVKIIVEVAIPETPKAPPAPKSKPVITGDTIIKLPQGTLLILPKSEYLSNPDGIFVEEFVSGESVREAGLTTMADDGSPLISGGMFRIANCEKDKCRTVLIPVRTVCGQEVPFTQWNADSINDTWSEESSTPLPIQTIDGRRYYTMTLCGCSYVNCDFRAPGGRFNLFSRKTKVKLKDGYTISNIRIATDDPLIVETPAKKSSNTAVFRQICSCSEPLIYIEATDKNGVEKIIQYRPLNNFDKREALGKCKTEESEKKILGFKVSRKTKYRKYLIHEADFEVSE